MAARETFNVQLKDLMKDVLEICDHAITSYELAFRALTEHSISLANYIIEQDKVINRLEKSINDDAILLITKQQPVATDLRRLVMQIKVASDMERIGDYSVNIAKEIIRIGNKPAMLSPEILAYMYRKSIKMLKLIIEAYAKEDIVEAREFALLDDEIDELYATVVKQFVQLHNTRESLSYSFISHYIERVADHATNVAEHLLYLKKGRHYNLNE